MLEVIIVVKNPVLFLRKTLPGVPRIGDKIRIEDEYGVPYTREVLNVLWSVEDREVRVTC